jgi:hypothetical protein
MRPGIAAVRAHWLILVLIQLGAVVLVVGYYHSASLQSDLVGLDQLKARGGSLFAFVAGMMAGGVIPEVFKLATGSLKRFDRTWLGVSAFNGFVYGIVGVQVEAFYRLQAHLFGLGHDPATLVTKSAFDLLVFTPVLSIPCATLLFVWRNHGFRMRAVFADGLGAFYQSQVMPGLVPCWFFWTPVLFCSYSMPMNLQFPFSTLAEAAWSIVFVFINSVDHAPMA